MCDQMCNHTFPLSKRTNVQKMCEFPIRTFSTQKRAIAHFQNVRLPNPDINMLDPLLLGECEVRMCVCVKYMPFFFIKNWFFSGKLTFINDLTEFIEKLMPSNKYDIFFQKKTFKNENNIFFLRKTIVQKCIQGVFDGNKTWKKLGTKSRNKKATKNEWKRTIRKKLLSVDSSRWILQYS